MSKELDILVNTPILRAEAVPINREAPWYIQGMTINKPMHRFAGMKLYDATTMTIKSGELPREYYTISLRTFQENQASFMKTTVSFHKDKGYVYLYHRFKKPDIDSYLHYLAEVFDGSRQTFRHIGFGAQRKEDDHEDLWWDIENHVFWTYNDDFMSEYLRGCLEQSYKYMAYHEYHARLPQDNSGKENKWT